MTHPSSVTTAGAAEAPSGWTVSERPLANGAGREYVLRVWRPADACGGQTLATLLMLDGHWLSEVVRDTLAGLPAGRFQVATLGYATNERKTIAPWRTYDYTTTGPDGCTQDARTPEWPCGGAPATLDFLRQTVLPLLTDEFGAASGQTALFGHSYAGLFSLHCLLDAPGLFRRICAASPSLWWYWPHMLTRVPAVLPPDTPPLQILIGGEERLRLQPALPGEPRPPGVSTVPHAQEFIAALAAAGHVQAALQVFPGQEHGPMLFCAARHAVEEHARSCA